MSRRITKPTTTTALSSALFFGLFVAACNPSPHIDPPGSGTSTAGSGGTGGTTSVTGGTGGSTGGTTSEGGTGGSPLGSCDSNKDCTYPKNLCDVVAHLCVECIVTADCAAKEGTVCSTSACVCPTPTDTYCLADFYGPARCVDVTTSGNDCGACGHDCFGSCQDSKCTDAWEPTAAEGAPSPRARHVAVWTGTKMIVWGGSNGGTYLGDGAIYDPDARTWTPMSTANAPSPRDQATAIWTGTKMIVWGGSNGGALGDGKAFDPANGPNGTWTNLAADQQPSPRFQQTAVWTGNPTTRMIVWGGYDGGTEVDTGASYTTTGDTWFALAGGAPTPRRLHTAVWDDANNRMIVFGGLGFDPNTGTTTSLSTGGIYGPLPGNEAWTDLGQIGSPPAPRYEHSAIWAGTYMIVWGGQNNAIGLLNDGARFNVAGNNEWSAMNGNPPSARRRHTAVFFKPLNRMIVWGGLGPGNVPLGDGGVFDTSGGGQWIEPSIPSGPDPSVDHTAVAAGNRMIIWGGSGPNGVTNKGAVLDMAKVP